MECLMDEATTGKTDTLITGLLHYQQEFPMLGSVSKQLRCHRSHIETSTSHQFAIHQLDDFHQQPTVRKDAIHLREQLLVVESWQIRYRIEVSVYLPLILKYLVNRK